MKLYKPKAGDWCWFKETDKSEITFGKFSAKSGPYYYARNHSNQTSRFLYCEQFIGTLPTFIKEP